MPTVWIANESGHDYSDAERFGDLQPLTKGTRWNPTKPDRIAHHLARAIGGFVESSEDFLLVSGSPVINLLAFQLWLSRFDKCRLLIWDAKTREYCLRTVTRDQLGGLVDRAIAGNL